MFDLKRYEEWKEGSFVIRTDISNRGSYPIPLIWCVKPHYWSVYGFVVRPILFEQQANRTPTSSMAAFRAIPPRDAPSSTFLTLRVGKVPPTNPRTPRAVVPNQQEEKATTVSSPKMSKRYKKSARKGTPSKKSSGVKRSLSKTERKKTSGSNGEGGDRKKASSGGRQWTMVKGKDGRLHKRQRREKWTDAEHDAFIEGMKLFKRDWELIAEHVKTKNAVQVRTHAYSHFNRRVRGNLPGVVTAIVTRVWNNDIDAIPRDPFEILRQNESLASRITPSAAAEIAAKMALNGGPTNVSRGGGGTPRSEAIKTAAARQNSPSHTFLKAAEQLKQQQEAGAAKKGKPTPAKQTGPLPMLLDNLEKTALNKARLVRSKEWCHSPGFPPHPVVPAPQKTISMSYKFRYASSPVPISLYEGTGTYPGPPSPLKI